MAKKPPEAGPADIGGMMGDTAPPQTKVVLTPDGVPMMVAAAPLSPDVEKMAGAIRPTPFYWIDPTTIPRRSWIYGRHHVRGFVTVTYAPGGAGKSMLAIAEALTMATGKPLLGKLVKERVRVWCWNGEDPRDELERRVMAAVTHYGLKAEDFEGWLYVDSGRTMPIVIAQDVKEKYTGLETRIAVPVVDAVKAAIKEMKIDVLIIDPFVSCHEVHENDNSAIHRVARAWAEIAEEMNCAIELVHHTRKTGGNAVTVEDGRGAGALTFAARSARAINTMTADEAKAADIPENRRRWHFRLDNGKANLAPPPERADWFKIVSVDVGVPQDFDDDPDTTGVVTAFAYPETKLRITPADVERAQMKIAAGGPWRESAQSKKQPWVGVPIAEALGIDLSSGVKRKAVVRLIKDWLRIGWLLVVNINDEHSKSRPCVVVGTSPGAARPSPGDSGDGENTGE